MSAQPEALDHAQPVAWVNAANLASAAVSRKRGGPFDQHTWSEQQTDYHATPLYAAAELRRLHAVNAQMLEALNIARQFMSVASDWNIDEAEINGEMRSTYDWIEVVDAAIAAAKEQA